MAKTKITERTLKSYAPSFHQLKSFGAQRIKDLSTDKSPSWEDPKISTAAWFLTADDCELVHDVIYGIARDVLDFHFGFIFCEVKHYVADAFCEEMAEIIYKNEMAVQIVGDMIETARGKLRRQEQKKQLQQMKTPAENLAKLPADGPIPN